MCTPLPFGRLIETCAERQGFVSNPHTDKLACGGQIPTDLVAVYLAVAVVVAVTGKAGESHSLKTILELWRIIIHGKIHVGSPFPIVTIASCV